MLQPGLVFCGKPFKRSADLIVRHHAGETTAALNLALKLILIHNSLRGVRNLDRKRRLADTRSIRTAGATVTRVSLVVQLRGG